MALSPDANTLKKVRVWDVPVRLFHWCLVLTIIGLFITAKLGGNYMNWHVKLGYTALGLISFRLIWGVIGNRFARFATFIRPPGSVWRYLRGLIGRRGVPEQHFLGHNPMGALSVIALLGSALFQAISGLFANDDIAIEGPYFALISKELSDKITGWHKLNSDLLLLLIGLHLIAIASYFYFKKDNLIRPMFTGDKLDMHAEDAPTAVEKARPIWLGWLVAIVVAGGTYAVVVRTFY